MNKFNMYEPIYSRLPKAPKLQLDYYELRVWRNHIMIFFREFSSKKEALKTYKQDYKKNEEQGNIYVEIIHVKPLKK